MFYFIDGIRFFKILSVEYCLLIRIVMPALQLSVNIRDKIFLPIIVSFNTFFTLIPIYDEFILDYFKKSSNIITYQFF